MMRQEPWISLFYRLKEFMKHPVTDLSALVLRVFARCAEVNSSPHARPGNFFDSLGKAVIRPRRGTRCRGGRETEAEVIRAEEGRHDSSHRGTVSGVLGDVVGMRHVA